MITDRLKQQMAFISEIERLKIVYRQNGVLGGGRQENSAEHSWHIALMALVLAEYAKEPVDTLKVVKMLLLHDLVEIHTGDTFLYDTAGREAVKASERAAAERVFGLLPEEQGREFLELWNEFERRDTPEALFAAVLDNLQPILNHYLTDNQNIKRKKLNRSQILARKQFIGDYSPELWEYALTIIDASVEKGLYLDA